VERLIGGTAQKSAAPAMLVIFFIPSTPGKGGPDGIQTIDEHSSPSGLGGPDGIQTIDEHSSPSGLQAKLLLILKRAALSPHDGMGRLMLSGIASIP
jgi:hypothetical protein